MQQAPDHVIAHAQCRRKNVAANTDGHRADGRPPHPVHAQAGKHVFDGIETSAQQRYQRCSYQSHKRATRKGLAPTKVLWAARGKMGPAPSNPRRAAAAVALARATGIKLRGFHSKSSSSTASSTAATGEANIADMPAAEPATISVLRSVSVRCT